MSYLGGVDYGSDQVSSHRYLDNMLLYNSDNKRHYSGYDYYPNGTNYNPPVYNKHFISTPTFLDNKDRKSINNNSKRVNKLSTLNNMTANRNQNTITEGLTDPLFLGSLEHILIFLIIFITIIYCLSLYRLTQKINDMRRYTDLTVSLETLRTLLLSTQLKK